MDQNGAAMGVVAYPGLGIYKSIRHAVHSKTRKEVFAARLADGAYLAQQHRATGLDEHVMQRFDVCLRK
jgi:hypothetical protein